MYPGIGIFGIEDSDSHYIKKFQENSFKVFGLCGPNTTALNEIAQKFGIGLVTTKADDLLLHAEINMIIFMKYVPNFCEHVCKALTVAGKHVICSQGFAVSTKQAGDMYLASLNYQTLLSVVENPMRFSPNFWITRDLISKKSIGQVLYVDCVIEASPQYPDDLSYRYELVTGGGFFQQYGILVIDAIINAISMPITTVQCNLLTVQSYPSTKNIFRRCDADDYFTFHAKFSNGIPLNIISRAFSSNLAGSYTQTVEFVGELGKIVLKNDSLELTHFDNVSNFDPLSNMFDRSQKVSTYPPVDPDNLDVMMQELKDIFSNGKYSPNKNQIHNFLTFEGGLYLTRIVDAAVESSRTGNTVHIKETIKHNAPQLHNPDPVDTNSTKSQKTPSFIRSDKISIKRK